MSSLNDVLQSEFELWVENLNESTTSLATALQNTSITDPENVSKLEQQLIEVEVDAAELEKFRPTTKVKTVNYDFSSAIKPLAMAKRLVAKAQTILSSAGKTATKQDVTPPKTAHTTRALPEIKVKPFSGDIVEYHSFITAFHLKYDNLPISKMEKLQHLKDHLSGDPSNAVKTLDLTDENYDRALADLKAKYEKQDEVIDALYHKLDQLPCANNSNASLRSTYFEIEGILSALESHQHDLDSFPPLRNKVYFKYPSWLMYQVCGKTKPTVREFQESIAATLAVRRSLETPSTSLKATTSALHTNNNQNHRKDRKSDRIPSRNEHSSTDKPLPTCVFCKQKHYSNDCTTYSTLSERIPLIKDRCSLCLSRDHRKNTCPKKGTCRFCKKFNSHHASLCPQEYDKSNATKNQGKEDKQQTTETEKETKSPPESQERLVGFIRNHQGAYTTALVTVVNPVTNRKYKARILFDNGSSDTYVGENAARRLGLKLSPFQTAPVNVFAVDQPVKIRTASTSFIITNDHDFHLEIAADTIQRVPQQVQLFNYTSFKEINPTYSDMRFIDQGESHPIDILLGSDYYFDIIKPESKITVHEGLYLFNTAFGWMIVGRSARQDSATLKSILFQMSPSQAIKELTSLESIGIKDIPLSVLQEEEIALKQFYDNVQFKENRYEVRFPWKQYPPPLSNNFGLAIGRLKSLQRKLNEDQLALYDSIIQQQLNDGIIEEVDGASRATEEYYLPHHPVITPEKSTQLRIVFDGKAKQGKNAKSINEVIYKGRNLLAEGCGIVLRFRLHLVAVVSDLEKAFHALGIHPSDRDFVRFLWFFNWKKPPTGKNLRIMRFLRVAFGIDASPFLLYATLLYHLLKMRNESNARFIDKLIRDLFADNVNTGFPDYKTALEFYQVAVELFNLCSMNLRAWATNNEELRSQLSQVNPSASISILGIRWNQYEDTLKIHKINGTEIFTLRSVLSVASTFYDPCGWWTPVTISAKIFIHELHLANYGWDDELSTNYRQEWEQIQSELIKTTEIKIPRYQFDIDEPASYQLHIFSDASVKAYSCVIYIRKIVDDQIETFLIMSKAKVVPAKPEYKVPKLELFGVVLAVRTLMYIRDQIPIQFTKTIVWCDSKCVLSWITNMKILPTFIQRRVDFIRSVNNVNFRYVASADNPADLPSRGTTHVIDSIWFNGPKWLKNKESEWPPEYPVELLENEYIDQPLTPTVAVITTPKYPFNLDASKVSSYLKLMRITMYVMKFLSKFKLSRRRGLFSKPTLHTAQMLWLQMEQSNHYYNVLNAIQSNHKHDLITKLNIYVDTNGLLRCAGRFQFAPLSPNEKSPLLLPLAKVSPFVVLLIQYYHELSFHAGTSHTLHAIRRKYWLPCGRRSVYYIIRKCMKCKRFTTRPFPQPTKSDLPKFRLEEQTPFQHIGIDTFGPLWCQNMKYYAIIIVDLVIRAVDIELLSNLTTEELLLALRRVIARRNPPALILSDNAAQFKIMNENLQSIFTHQFEWKFIPEHSPWMGGAYERFVGLVKSCLFKTYHNINLSPSELQTSLAEIAATLNSRPLTYVSREYDDQVLTPNHFLQSYYELQMINIENLQLITRDNIQKIAKQSVEINNRFWSAFKSAYLQYLRDQATKYNFPQKTTTFLPQIGDVVLIYERLLKRQKWKIGKVIQLNTSTDGQVRSVKMKTSHGVLIRPLKEVYPLEIRDNSVDSVPASAVSNQTADDEDEWDNPVVTVQEIEVFST